MLLFCRISVNGQEYNPCPPNDGNPQFLECYSYPDGLCILNSDFTASEDYTFGTGPGSVTTNGGFPSGGGTVQGQNIIINGLYEISVDVEFIDCVFKMGPGAEIRIIDNAGGNLNVSFKYCDFFSCNNLWTGITTQFSNTLNPTLLDFVFQNNRVENAYIALNLEEGANNTYEILLNTFENNYIGIANRKKNFSFLNALIYGNEFQGTNTLLPSLPPLPSISPSLAYAGVKLENVDAQVGVPVGVVGNPSITNFFRCLLEGVHTTNSVTYCYNNHFYNMERVGGTGHGIYADDGTVQAYNNVFERCRENGIYAIGAHLFAERNRFLGRCDIGILSNANLNAEKIRIRDHNEFLMGNDFLHGISVSRSVDNPTNSPTNVINDNDFIINITDKTLSNAYGIKLTGVFNATAAFFEMAGNDMDITCAGGLNAIEIVIAQANDLWIHDNLIDFTYPPNGTGLNNIYGISLASFGVPSAAIINTRVHRNIITGTGQSFVGNNIMTCAIHFDGIKGVEFCGNVMDRSARGIHAGFGATAVFLRENEFKHHNECLLLNTNIGPQPCRGNLWPLTITDCTNFAAQNTALNPFNSLIEVCESTALPFLPPASSVDPMNGWVQPNPTLLQDYCNYNFLPPNTLSNELSWFEEAEVNGQGSYSSFVEQWEVQQKLYAKLHEQSDLRPTGSAAATFYNFHSGSLLAGFAQVELLINNAMTISAADQAAFNQAQTNMGTAAQALLTLDAQQDFNNPSSLTNTYFGSRSTHLTNIASNHVQEQNTQITRETNMLTGLQAALNANNALNTATPYEIARKYILGYRINRLLGISLTQSEYQYLKSIADGDPALLGHDAIHDAVSLLKPCDQISYITQETHNEGEHANPIIDRQKQDKNLLDFHIAPNPTNGSAIIVFDEAIVARIELIDLMGRLQLRQIVGEKQPNVTLDLAKMPQGILKVRCFDQSGRFLAEKNLFITH